MTAYNPITLLNIRLIKKAKHWYANKMISEKQFLDIKTTYKNDFYTPNVFVKIGLFIFTYFIIVAAIGMYLFLFTSVIRDNATGFGVATSFLFAVGCLVSLEAFIKQKKLYHAGIDEALLYSGLSFLISFLIMLFDIADSHNYLLMLSISLPILGFAAIRYTDRLITLIFGLCLYGFLFFLVLRIGDIAKLIMPFVIMVLSVALFFQARKSLKNERFIYWEQCLVVLKVLSLLMFYAAGNYFVIREASVSFFRMDLSDGKNIPLAFVFYALTAIIPIVYIYVGLKNKSKLFLWVGLVLLAFAVLTFKYYFSLGHPEITLTIAGTLLILTAYFAINYLKKPKHGITFEEEIDEDSFIKTNAEALLIAQTFTQQSTPNPANDIKFGGGESGGAGSGGTF
jgi:hypothetical protein